MALIQNLLLVLKLSFRMAWMQRFQMVWPAVRMDELQNQTVCWSDRMDGQQMISVKKYLMKISVLKSISMTRRMYVSHCAEPVQMHRTQSLTMLNLTA